MSFKTSDINIQRRRVLGMPIVLGSIFILRSESISAATQCGSVLNSGIQQCESGIGSQMMHVAAASTAGQHQSQWCWAACIEMVFRYYGYSVSQERIVRETWGQIVNLPGQPDQILQNLNRLWKDDFGRVFSVSGDVYSAEPVTAAQDLSNDMPLIIGTMGHAMVLTSLEYFRDQYARGQVTKAIVRDPWPGRGRRVLSAQEWFSTNFLARIRIT